MPKRILVDAVHPEETRVVLLENGRVTEFDSETALKTQVKGNIYLAKVTRVEASLQAAFVEYGGNKHGFLPFSEVHPDYYNIPVSDKQALLASMRQSDDSDNDDAEEETSKAPKRRGRKSKKDEVSKEDESKAIEETCEEETIEADAPDDERISTADLDFYKKYKIQEVIKRNQIILIQVEKEERGNKGASLTSFISLAGKYCVLMPNALRKGGVSRRIGDYEDRKRLKKVIKSLDVPQETGLIVRTAGAGRSEEEIRADYDYLASLWNDIRNLTLSSDAPAFIHAEGDVVKRTIRDLYDADTDEVLIEGNAAYESAKGFMKTLMPTHSARIKHYQNKVPIFSRYRVEEQIADFYTPEAQLESGGSIVINPTEALISIDINSGKATGQRNVEGTALATNLEAAYEIARQMRLRDLSGLIVIDFIDMLELKNKKAIERALKDAFRDDKARIQIGRISSFGLLEMSRQRMRPSFYEINTVICPHCQGTGHVHAASTLAVTALKALESMLSRSKAATIKLSVKPEVALYILNHKRDKVSALEESHGVRIEIAHEALAEGDDYIIEENPSEGSGKRHSASRQSKRKNNSSNDNQPYEKTDQPAKKDAQKAPSKAEKKVAGFTSALEGLWRKIIEP